MTVRWGIIGAGGVARRRTMPAIKKAEGAELQALMVRDLDRARKLAEEFGAKVGYDSVEALLSDEAVDAVHVATPVYLHREQVIRAAESGKHVLCEKPMAMSSKECREMIAACRANGVELMVCFLLRFHTALRKIKELIASGRLGTIMEARCQLMKWMDRDQDAWRIDPGRSGGGVLMDIGSHTLDLLSTLLGDIVEVSAVLDHRVFGWQVEDTAHVLMRFESGACGQTTVSFAVPHSESFLEVYVTEGTALVYTTTPHVEGWTIRVYADKLHPSDEGPKEWSAPSEDLYQAEVEHFARVLAGEELSLAPGIAGLRNLAVIEAAYRSAAEKRVIQVK